MLRPSSSHRRLVLAVFFGSFVPTLLAQPATVVVDAVRLEEIEVWRQVTGELRSLRRSSLAAEEPGLVVELPVAEGDAVEKGDVIAVLDTTLAEIAIESAEAQTNAINSDIQRINVELSQVRRDLDQITRMSSQDASSVTELERAQTTVGRWDAQLARAQAELAAAKARHREAIERKDDMTIRAPFQARVTRKHTELGQWVSRGDEVIELVSLREIEARLDVPESLIWRLEEASTKVRLRIEAMRDPVPDEPAMTVAHEELAVVWRIIPDADPRTRQFTVRVPITNPQERGRPGMSVVGFVPAGGFAPEITIHKDAILRDDAGEFVFFDDDGKAMPARIRTKYAAGDRVAIMPGRLQPGMRVIVEGNERLYATQEIIVSAELQAKISDDPQARDAG